MLFKYILMTGKYNEDEERSFVRDVTNIGISDI